MNCGKKLKPKFNWLAIFFAVLFVIAAGFAIVFYNSSNKHSPENSPLTDSIPTPQPAETPNGISISTNANGTMTEINTNGNPVDTTINGKRIIVNTGGVIIKKQMQKQEQQVKPPDMVEQAKKQKAEQAKQVLEKANAAFQKGIDTGNFEEAYQLYLKSNKKEGYRKFKERADMFPRINEEYQYYMDYANKLK